ncbi:MAG: YhbY family RNA-binding protein, partial [Pseudomonadota bacterium]
MDLSPSDKKRLIALGHVLHPVVTVANKGLHAAVLREIAIALKAHELVKFLKLSSSSTFSSI